MKTEYIHEFLTLAETGSYSASADRLYISQSTLTRHMQDLEQELTIPLFVRTAYGITLTEGGKLFTPYAQKAIQLQKDCLSAVSSYLEKLNGNISLGTIFAMPEYGISPILYGWNRTHSSVKFRIMEGDSEEILGWLRRGMVDFAFVREDFPDMNSDFERITITSDRLVCLVPESDPLAARSSISIAQLKDTHILYYEQCPLLNSLFLGAGYDPTAGLSGAHGRNAVVQVKSGLGTMLEFRKQIGDWEMGGFSILNIEPAVERNISFLYRSVNTSKSVQEFVQYVAKYMQTAE